MRPADRPPIITGVETMRAVRKLAREPGLVLDEVPVPLPLERFDEAFDLLASGEACKIVLHPGAAS